MFEGIKNSLSSRVRILILASVLLTGLLFCVSTYFSLNAVRDAVLKTGIEDAFSGVNQNIKLFDQLLYSQEEGWDAMFQEKLPELASYITEFDVVPSDLSPEMLSSIASDHGFSSLYIVNEDLVVVATSYAPEMGLDLKSFSTEYTDYLREIQKSGLVHVDRVSTSSVTGKIKKYGYYNPPGSIYLINTDIDVLDRLRDDTAYDFGEFLFRDLRNNIKEENNLVDAFDLFIITEIDRWSMLNEGGTLDDLIASRVYDGESEVSTFEENRTIYREVMLPNHDNPGVKFVAAVTFNDGVFSDSLVQNTAIVMIFGLVLSLAVSLVLSSLFFGRNFVRRLQLITAGVADMARDPTFRISVSGKDDIAVAAGAINELANQVETRERNLQDANQGLERKVMERTRELLIAKQ